MTCAWGPGSIDYASSQVVNTGETPVIRGGGVTLSLMRGWIFSVLGGLALAPVGAVVGLVIAYAVVGWRGVTEYQGKRGMLAFLYALILGVPLGFWAGFRLARWLCVAAAVGSQGAGVGLGALLSILGMLAAGFPAMVYGSDLAEGRRVANHPNQRNVWALWRVALPAALLGGVAVFLIAWYLAPRSSEGGH